MSAFDHDIAGKRRFPVFIPATGTSSMPATVPAFEAPFSALVHAVVVRPVSQVVGAANSFNVVADRVVSGTVTALGTALFGAAQGTVPAYSAVTVYDSAGTPIALAQGDLVQLRVVIAGTGQNAPAFAGYVEYSGG